MASNDDTSKYFTNDPLNGLTLPLSQQEIQQHLAMDPQKIKEEMEKIKKEQLYACLQDGKMIPSEGMDDANRAAAKVYNEQGIQAFAEYISTGENGEKLTYAEMRHKYG